MSLKHKLVFASLSEAKAISQEDLAKYSHAEELGKLNELFPSNINLKENIDLIGITLDAAVGGLMNKNFQAISNRTLVKVAKNFLWKPVDIEHDRTKCIGVICNYGFSTFSNNKRLLTNEEAALSVDPVNLSLAILLWSDIVPDLLLDKIIDSSDPGSTRYANISASWEIFCDNYDIAVSPTLKLKDASIYKGEDKRLFESYLVENNGSGKIVKNTASGPVTNYIFTVFSEEDDGIVLPAGIGLVKNPAAFVKGLSIMNKEEIMKESECVTPSDELKTIDKTAEIKIEVEIEPKEETEKDDKESEDDGEDTEDTDKKEKELDEESEQKAATELDAKQKCATLEEKTSKNINNCVNNHIETKESLTMKLNSIKDLTEENIKLASASDVLSLWDVAVKEANEKYEAELNKVVELEKSEAKLKLELQNLQTSIATLTSQLNSIETSAANQEKTRLFNTRMEDFLSTYTVSEAGRGVIAKELSGLDNTDESYDSYKVKMGSLLPLKVASVEVVKTEDKKEEIAPDAKDLKVIIASADTKDEVILPNTKTVNDNENLTEKYKRVFNTESLTKIKNK